MSLEKMKKLTLEYAQCGKKLETKLKALPVLKKQPKGTVISKKSKELLAKTLKKLEKIQKTQVENDKRLKQLWGSAAPAH